MPRLCNNDTCWKTGVKLRKASKEVKVLRKVINRLNDIIAEDHYNRELSEESRRAYDEGWVADLREINAKYNEGDYHCDIDFMIEAEGRS